MKSKKITPGEQELISEKRRHAVLVTHFAHPGAKVLFTNASFNSRMIHIDSKGPSEKRRNRACLKENIP